MSANDLAERVQHALGDGYVVERALGEGGFAVVYLVRDVALKRHLAVKVLSPDLITSHTVLERFRREAETVAQLSHPNIVPLHFIGEEDGLLYLAMACVDGGSVADRLEKGALPIDDSAKILMEVASALAHAHKRGVVHRDVKPHNVLLDAESGRALVTDFGIARTADSSLTLTGMFVGTPAYISPEQVTGEESDHRADIYALGVMGYEMLAGKLPFEGNTPTAMLMKRLSGMPTPLVEVRREIPASLAAVITRCLAPDPAERYQTASEVAAALGGVATGSSETVSTWSPAANRGPRRRVSAGMLVVAALVVAVVAAGALLRNRTAEAVRPVAAAAVTPPVTAAMILIPQGRYRIGSDSDTVSPPRPSSRPAHVATLSAYRIGRGKVTIGEYKHFADATGAQMPRVSSTDSLSPVTGVLWAEAASYCAWSHAPGGRLPTEEEWEAAVRAEGGTKLESPLRDLWEWTSSPVRAYPGAPALPDSMREFRVIRGGAADTPMALATPWFRGYGPRVTRREFLSQTGFRCADAASGRTR
jgi:serine/threonine protein kinase